MGAATEETARGANQVTEPIQLYSGTSPAEAGYAVGEAVSGFAKCQWIAVLATITGATGGTIDVIIDHSPDGGSNWYELVHLPQSAAAAAVKTVSWEPGSGGTCVVVGKNQTTAAVLASGASSGEMWFDTMRVRLIAGTSTSAGAVQSVKVVGLYRGK